MWKRFGDSRKISITKRKTRNQRNGDLTPTLTLYHMTQTRKNTRAHAHTHTHTHERSLFNTQLFKAILPVSFTGKSVLRKNIRANRNSDKLATISTEPCYRFIKAHIGTCFLLVFFVNLFRTRKEEKPRHCTDGSRSQIDRPTEEFRIQIPQKLPSNVHDEESY